MLQLVQGLSPYDVIDTFLQSNIRNKQLREAFEAEDATKKGKLASKEDLEKKINYYEEEVEVIGEYIRRLADDEELRMEVLLQETRLGNREPSIVFENAAEATVDEESGLEEDSMKL